MRVSVPVSAYVCIVGFNSEGVFLSGNPESPIITYMAQPSSFAGYHSGEYMMIRYTGLLEP